MRIGIDISPLSSGHKVRGVGFYLKHLKSAMEKYFPQENYIFFQEGEDFPTDIDVVHYPYFDPFSLSLTRNKKQKTVVTVHDLTPLVMKKDFPVGIKGRLRWEMQKRVLRGVDAIITDSEASKKDIVRLVGVSQKKVSVVYLAAGESFKRLSNIQQLTSNISKKYHLPGKFVLYVGDATPNKNVPMLLQACIKKNMPLVLAGKALASSDFDHNHPWNKDLVHIEKLAKENKNILRLGFVSDEDLVAIYNLATIFVFPSRMEGFGLPILEAMACGCPVVCGKVSSLPEVAGEAAYFVDIRSVDALAEGIEKVFDDSQLQKELSEKGLEQVKKFSWKKTAEETMEVYKKVCN